MILSIDGGKVFQKKQVFFMIKKRTLSRLRIEGNILRLIKGDYRDL